MTRFSLCFHPSACLLSNSSLFSLTRSFQDHLLPESFPSSPSLNLVLLLFVSLVLLDHFRLSTYHTILIVCFHMSLGASSLKSGAMPYSFQYHQPLPQCLAQDRHPANVKLLTGLRHFNISSRKIRALSESLHLGVITRDLLYWKTKKAHNFF